jgi:hypothetical protein
MKFIAIGHHVWSKKDTIAEAVKDARARLGHGMSTRHLKANVPAFEVFHVHDDSGVTDWGSITYPNNNDDDAHAPRSIGIFDWNGKALLPS